MANFSQCHLLRFISLYQMQKSKHECKYFVFSTPASWGPTISNVFDPQKPYFSGQDWCVPWLHIPRGQFDMSVHITHSLSVEIIEVFQIEKPSLIPIGQLKCVKKSHYFIMNVLFNITMFAWI